MISLVFSFFIILSFHVAQSQTHINEENEGKGEVVNRDINDVMEAHTEKLMSIPGVVGVYIGALDNGTPCIKVMVIEETPELNLRTPKALEGHPVVTIQTGEIHPFSK